MTVVIVLMIQIPIFRKICPKKYVLQMFISFSCTLVILVSMILSTENQGPVKEIIGIDPEMEVSFGFKILYSSERRFTNFQILKFNKHNIFIFQICIMAIASSIKAYKYRLGALGDEFFPDTINDVEPLPPKSEFKNLSGIDLHSLCTSYYINCFIKKFLIVMDLDVKKCINSQNHLQPEYLRDIPYLDHKRLKEKILWFKEHKFNQNSKSSKRNFLLRIYKIIMSSISTILTLSNFVTASVLIWIIVFVYFKNNEPTIWTFVSLVAVSTIGLVSFHTFLFLGQIFIVIPLVINATILFITNMPYDRLHCPLSNTPTEKSSVVCISWLGFHKHADENKMKLNLGILVFLYQFITFIFKLLSKSEGMFQDMSKTEMKKDIDENLSRGAIPYFKMGMIQVAGRFYWICFFMIIWVGTLKASLTNMTLLSFLLFFVSKLKLVRSRWTIFYLVVNFIVIGGFLIDLIFDKDNLAKQGNQTLINILNYFGLPSSLVDKNNNERKFLVLYVCTMFQQIASKNMYIQMYLAKINQLKDNQNVFVLLKNCFSKAYSFGDRIYYGFGVWISYFLSITLTLMMSICLSRGILLIMILITFIAHLEALRRSYDTGYLNLRLVYSLWKIYGILKVFVLVMLIFGTFIL